MGLLRKQEAHTCQFIGWPEQTTPGNQPLSQAGSRINGSRDLKATRELDSLTYWIQFTIHAHEKKRSLFPTTDILLFRTSHAWLTLHDSLYELEDIWTSARASPQRNRALESKAAVDGVNRSERPPRHRWRKSGAIAHRFPPLAAERRRRRLHPRRRFWGGWKGKKTSQSTLQEGHFCKKSY
jgi:hypothetical protein